MPRPPQDEPDVEAIEEVEADDVEIAVDAGAEETAAVDAKEGAEA
jgi:hypothetical protein